jgi:hypothetical protein
MRPHATWVGLVLALAAAGCEREAEGGGALREQRGVLQREVDGLREVVERLDRGEPMLPADDVAVAIEESLVREMVALQLPFDADVDGYHLRLTDAEVEFRSSPLVRLRGILFQASRPTLTAEVTATGALADIAVDRADAVLRAALAIDHISIDKAAGLEEYVSRVALDEVAREIRLATAGRLPSIQMPVQVQQRVEIPALSLGPVRIEAATMPLTATVSQVLVGRGRLWIAIHVEAGAFTRTPPAPTPTRARAPAVKR